jgi:iron complex transport system substrate-binding protein
MKIGIILANIAMSLLLVLALPAAASDYTLGVFGNANEDDTINMQDVTYTELIILEYRDKTELSDAKHDGKINMQDVTQIELVILGKEKELTLLDSADRIVTVKKPIERLVLTFPHHLEALRSLDVPTDTIVGVAKERYDMAFFPEIADIPGVGWRWTPDVEEILNLHPDVVFINSLIGFKMKPTADALESAGITVLALNFQTPDMHREEVEKAGYIFGRRDCAEEYLNWRANILNSVEETVDRLSEEDKPEVYFMPAFNDGVYYIYGQYAYIAETGGIDIFADQPGSYMSVDPEVIIERNPDIIVRVAPWDAGGYGVAAGDTAGLEALREEITSQPELQNVKAVNDGKVYIMTVHLASFFPVSGCRQFAQIAYQAKWSHPELFEDLDPEAIHQEYLTEFQGLDIDLDEKGVFIYPPLERS